MQWEYKIVDFPMLMFKDESKRTEHYEQMLNELGKAGWEAVNMGQLCVLMKRQIQ